MIHRETFRASVLNHSDNNAVLQSIAVKKCLLTTPSLLSKGTQNLLLCYVGAIRPTCESDDNYVDLMPMPMPMPMSRRRQALIPNPRSPVISGLGLAIPLWC